MKTIYLDLESVPLPTADLEAQMPEEIRAPEMPADIANPVEPDYSGKCPKYGGDEEKRQAWIKEAAAKWLSQTRAAREKWEQTALETRAKFIETAALRAESAHCKLIGLSINGERSIYLFESDKSQVAIAEKECTAQGVALFSPFMLEKQMFQRFAKDFIAMMEWESEVMLKGAAGYHTERNRVVTYYGNTFDLPFLARRAAICGEPALMKFLRKHRRGRYLDSTRFVDLHEEWKQGDNETRTGGISGLAKMLGVPVTKNGEGQFFYRLYAENPAEGIAYNLNDLNVLIECAGRMGIE